MGEFLALGVPMLTNGGVGDVDRIMTETGAGVVVDRFDDAAYATAIDRLETMSFDEAQWRQAADRWFSLERGVEAYDQIYLSLTQANQR